VVAAGAVTDLVVGDRVKVLVDQAGWVVVLLWEAHGARILAGQGNNCEVVHSVGGSRCLGPQERDDLDVVASTGLVAERLKPDAGARGGGKGLPDDRLAWSCPATRNGFLWRQTAGMPEKFVSPHRVKWASLSATTVQLESGGNLKVDET
jgi:hypothetical protein